MNLNLREINLDYNKFTKIPNEILELPQLTCLSMIKNNISSFSNLIENQSIKKLFLTFNRMTNFKDLKVTSPNTFRI